MVVTCQTSTLTRVQIAVLVLFLLLTRIQDSQTASLPPTTTISGIGSPCTDGLTEYVHRMRVSPLSEVDRLMRGMNMISYAGPRGFWFNLGNGTMVWESVEPYWFRIGFDEERLETDLDALQTMGVKYVRSYALIFQFLEWHPMNGYTGLNTSSIANFNTFLRELSYRGMILTVTFMTPLWSLIDHPSLLQYYRVFNSSSGMSAGALQSVRDAVVDFVEHYQSNDVIFSWDLVGGFSEFISHLRDPINGFGLDVNPVSMFDFIKTTANEIRGVDEDHLVTMSDDWPQNFGEDSWLNGHVPPFYNESLLDLVDYVSVRVFSDNSTLPVIRYLRKPVMISEIASTQPLNTDRQLNSKMLLDAYADAINKSYSGFAPWEFSRTAVLHQQHDPGSENLQCNWTWDALLLFSLYRDDTVSFLSTSDYCLLSTQPIIDIYGHVTFELFLPEDVGQNEIMVSLASGNLIMATDGALNSHLNISIPAYQRDELEVLGAANTLVTVSKLGKLVETGIRIENCSSWTSSVVHYQSRRVHFVLNAFEPADVIIENGLFNLVTARNYRIVNSNLASGDVLESLAQANQYLELLFSIEEGSILIKVTPLVDLLNLFSVGTSIAVIVVSIGVYCYMDRRRP